jgi:hypothetical protein
MTLQHLRQVRGRPAGCEIEVFGPHQCMGLCRGERTTRNTYGASSSTPPADPRLTGFLWNVINRFLELNAPVKRMASSANDFHWGFLGLVWLLSFRARIKKIIYNSNNYLFNCHGIGYGVNSEFHGVYLIPNLNIYSVSYHFYSFTKMKWYTHVISFHFYQIK